MSKTVSIVVNTHKYTHNIILDQDVYELIKHHTITAFKSSDNKPIVFVRINNKNYNLAKLLTGYKRLFYKDGNKLNCTIDNITNTPKEIKGYIKKRSADSKIRFATMEQYKRDAFFKGIENRQYTKDYSDKLALKQIGEGNTQNKLTWEEVNEIRDSYHNFINQEEIAKMYGVKRTAIADILNYRTWIVNKDLNERIYKTDRVIDMSKAGYYTYDAEFKYEDLKYNHILYLLENEKIYVEKLYVKRLVYIEVRDLNDKFVCCCNIRLPEERDYRMKHFCNLLTIKPSKLKRSHYYSIINRLGRIINYRKELM